MNASDLTTLCIGLGMVALAYFMKHKGYEGFQNPSAPMAGTPPPMLPSMPMPSPVTGQAPPPPPMPPPPPPPPMPPSVQAGQTRPPSAPVPGAPAQPTPISMAPNQQQLMDLSEKVKRIGNQQQELNEISQQLKQMTQSFMSTPEGFQSYQNPYDAASPGDTQSMEFRLGKKSLVDSVLRY